LPFQNLVNGRSASLGNVEENEGFVCMGHRV